MRCFERPGFTQIVGNGAQPDFCAVAARATERNFHQQPLPAIATHEETMIDETAIWAVLADHFEGGAMPDKVRHGFHLMILVLVTF